MMNGAVALVRRHRYWVLFLVVLLLMGTSRPLDYKPLKGEAVEIPESLAVLEAPEGNLGENVNNQGCFADQVLDLQVSVEVRNEGGSTVIIEEEQTRLFINGVEESMKEYQVTSSGVERGQAFRTYEIEVGDEERLVLQSTAFLPNEALESTQEIEVVVPLGEEELRVVFEDVDEVETRTW